MRGKKRIDYIIVDDIDTESCDHKDTSLVVIEVVATCEKTALQCDYCGKILTEPKTDCR